MALTRNSLPVSENPNVVYLMHSVLMTCHAELGQWARIPTTYAGGAKDISDLDLVDRLSAGKVDLTYGRSEFFFVLDVYLRRN